MTSFGYAEAGPVKYLVFKGQVIPLKQVTRYVRVPHGYINRTELLSAWEDRYGTVYAFPDDGLSADKVTRCGISVVSLPSSHPLTDACRAHDYAYSSPVYQVFHTREEADAALKKAASILGYPVVGTVFQKISRWFGGMFWENKETR